MDQQQIFENKEVNIGTPLSEKLRPISLDEYIGQGHLVGRDGILRSLIEKDQLMSIILWGPPGVGKTTLARIIANETKSKFLQVSAVSSGKSDLKYVIKSAKETYQLVGGKKTILFIDEIHRFNKIQQDYLLPFVEDGTIILVGATTENPSFEVIGPLLSRCRVFTLNRHSPNEMEEIFNRVRNYYFKEEIEIQLNDDTKNYLINMSNGDPRVLINAIEMSVNLII